MGERERAEEQCETEWYAAVRYGMDTGMVRWGEVRLGGEGRETWRCGCSACVQEMEMRLISVKYAIISGARHKQVCARVCVLSST